MADTTTISGLPFPEGSDANNVPSDMADLANALDGTIIRKLSTAGIAGLAAGEKPAGTLVYNTTTSKFQVSNGSTFADWADATKLPLAGGKMTGDLEIEKATARVYLDADSGDLPAVIFQKGGVTAFGVEYNSATGLNITRFNPSTGNYIDSPLVITPTGKVSTSSHIGGTKTATTNGSGEVTLTLPTSPTGNWAVSLGVVTMGTILMKVTATTSTSATIRVITSGTGSDVTGTSVTFLYTAIAY